jgi:ferric-dicitrate binding protein FerR (iron transport regulator)
MLCLKRLVNCAPVLLAGFAVAVEARAGSPQPGAINCVEGQVFVDGQAAVTGESAAVKPGQLLETSDGRAEILLTPGVFLRAAANSAVKLDTASPRNVRVDLVRGEALVEVAQMESADRLEVVDKGASTRLEKNGVYLFNATNGTIIVYAGKARVNDDSHTISLAKGEELSLAGDTSLKPRKADPASNDSLYTWSRQRADYDAEASKWTAESLIVFDNAPHYATG